MKKMAANAKGRATVAATQSVAQAVKVETKAKGGSTQQNAKAALPRKKKKNPTSIESDRAQGPKTGRSPELEVNLKALLLIIPEAARDVVKCIVRNANDGIRESFSVSLYNRCLR